MSNTPVKRRYEASEFSSIYRTYNSSQAKVPTIAAKITRTEEAAFPRGGASVLTPLEHKQIGIDATRDVLFEQGAKSSKPDGDGENGTAQPRKKSKGKGKGKSKQNATATEPEEDVVKIEGLSYKVRTSLL